MAESSTIISHIADTGGCAFYRMRTPLWSAQMVNRNLKFIESPKFIPIEGFYKDIKLVRLQRQISAAQCDYFSKFLKPLSNRFGFWINYEVDDVVGKDDIPKYNSGWEAYQDPSFYNNIKTMMVNADYLTVTCQALADYYEKSFQVQSKNILIIPNYIPKWWMSNCYNIDKVAKRYDSLSTRKPRICFPCSSTHYDIYNRNGGVDDFTHITDFVRSTIDKYDWIFLGGLPHQLKDLLNDKKLQLIVGYDLFNYPLEFSNLNPDIVVAPLQDNIFNRCKSNIKYTEMSAMGFPAVYQNLEPYKKYTNWLFNDANNLQDQIDSILKTKEGYLDIVKNGRNIVDNGDKHSPNGWWLENNISTWINFFSIAQRTLTADLSNEITKRYSNIKTQMASNPDKLVQSIETEAKTISL